jgi:very-short-patch-repair endonuclease
VVSVEITGYLLQKKLENALKAIVGEEAWRGRELKVPNSRRRWDMAYEIDNKVMIVEFDGDAHYRDPLKIKVDHEKDNVASELGYKVVRVPY